MPAFSNSVRRLELTRGWAEFASTYLERLQLLKMGVIATKRNHLRW